MGVGVGTVEDGGDGKLRGDGSNEEYLGGRQQREQEGDCDGKSEDAQPASLEMGATR